MFDPAEAYGWGEREDRRPRCLAFQLAGGQFAANNVVSIPAAVELSLGVELRAAFASR
jgi:hypothetical protein